MPHGVTHTFFVVFHGIVQQRYGFVPGDFPATVCRCLSRESPELLTYNYLAFIHERKSSRLAYARLLGGLILARHAEFHGKLKFLFYPSENITFHVQRDIFTKQNSCLTSIILRYLLLEIFS